MVSEDDRVDIWDKKPEARVFTSGPIDMGGGYNTLTIVYYSADEMDDWLEEIKPYIELAEQIIESFNEPLSHDKVIELYKGRANAEKRYAWLFEAIQKAKQYDGAVEMLTQQNQALNSQREEAIILLGKSIEKIKSSKDYLTQLIGSFDPTRYKDCITIKEELKTVLKILEDKE